MGTPTHVGTVRRVERLTADLVRVILGGPGLAAVKPVPWSDAYVNLLSSPPGAVHGARRRG